MEGSPNFKEPSDKKIIIDDLASYEEEIGVGRGVKRGGGFGDFLKNIFVGILLIGIVVGSFWVSFLIGKRVLVPVKQLETRTLPPIEEAKPIQEEDLSAYATVETNAQTQEEYAKRIEPKTDIKTAPPEPMKYQIVHDKYYKVEVGLFTTKAEADALVASLKTKGISSFIKKVSSSGFRVQAGAYKTKEKAQQQVNELKTKGVNSDIIYE